MRRHRWKASRQYGPHVKHAFDIYYPEDFDPETDDPLPFVVNIHGGGWGALDKINPNMGSTADTLRHHAGELGLDPARVALTGGSAGGATSAWLALVDDLADAESPDPIARESTRVTCSMPRQAQTSLDPQQMREWIPSIQYGAHAFFSDLPKKGEERFDYFLEHRESIQPHIEAFSAYHQASEDDPPMLLNYGGQPDIIPAVDNGNATHHPRFGAKLNQRLQELGVESYFWAGEGNKEKGAVEAKNPRYDGWPGMERFVLDQFGLSEPQGP